MPGRRAISACPTLFRPLVIFAGAIRGRLPPGQACGPLPSSEIVLHSTLTDPRSKAALRTIVSAFREHRGAIR